MSTTVITSRQGLSLYLLPAAGPALDVAALRAVLVRHGVRLLEASDLGEDHELIVAQDLDHVAAAALAEDLRAIGLTTRVVNRSGLTGSRRVGNALATQFMLGLAGLMAVIMSGSILLKAAKSGAPLDSPLMWVALVLGAALMMVTAFNAFSLQRTGGLRVAGVKEGEGAPRLLTDQLSELQELLPDHLAASFMARARRLEAHAKRDPEGLAAKELQALIDELRGQADEQAAVEARELREEVARARRALQETQGR